MDDGYLDLTSVVFTINRSPCSAVTYLVISAHVRDWKFGESAHFKVPHQMPNTISFFLHTESRRRQTRYELVHTAVHDPIV